MQCGAGAGDAGLPRARHWLWVFTIGNISAVLASWETGLGCPVTAPRDTRLACRAAGAEGWLPWHIWTGAGRSWAAWAALTPRGPPAAPRLPNFAAEPGQLLLLCPRSAALRSPSRSPRLPRSLLLLLAPQLSPGSAESPLPPGPSRARSPGSALETRLPLRSPARSRGHSHGSARGMWGALPGPARCAVNSSRVCQQPLGTPGHGTGTGTWSTRPARSSSPGCGRNDSARSPLSHLLFF